MICNYANSDSHLAIPKRLFPTLYIRLRVSNSLYYSNEKANEYNTRFNGIILECHINSTRISSEDSVRDLGVKQTTDSTYSEHCNDVIAKANSTCGALRRIFKSGHYSLLWPPFVSYVLSVQSQCSSVWNPYLKSDIVALESVQRNFMRRIRGLEQLPYNVRLAALSALMLENRKHLTDMSTVYKFLHGL